MKNFQVRFYLLIFFCLVVTAEVFSQGNRRQFEERYRHIEAQRVAYITRELSLTPDEAQVFWPIYNEYNEKRNQLMIRHRRHRNQDGDLSRLSEKELNELADADINNFEEMAALRREYHEKFKQVLPIIKVIQLYNTERDFSRKLFNDNRDSRPGGDRND